MKRSAECQHRNVNSDSYAFGFCQSLANVFWLAQYQSPKVHLIFLWRSCRKTFYQFWAFSKQVVDSFFVSRIKYATNWKDDVATEGTVFWMWFSFRLSEYADSLQFDVVLCLWNVGMRWLVNVIIMKYNFDKTSFLILRLYIIRF